ncbi:MAG: NAD(P)/FAD-dependent oxidoreductase [Candidatus Aenigmatarchaeota archaeon]
MDVDVLVVGVGPAGASAAKTLAQAGIDVLAIEKRQEIGSPKRCGEGLSRSALQRMGIELDKRWVCQEIERAAVFAPNGRKVIATFSGAEGWVIERKLFDKELAKQAASAGAKIWTKTELLGLKKEKNIWKAETNRGEIEAKMIIAADGVESTVARLAGIDTTLALDDIASCAQYEMSGIDIDPKQIELYFGNNIAPGGYVWIFPKGKNSANVGIGVRRPYAKKTALEYLDKFIADRPGLANGSKIEMNSGGVPVGGLMHDMTGDGILIAGDAAHQVNPIHGGGISEGYVGGRIAGQVAAKAIKAGDWSKKALSEYNRLWWSERGHKLEKILKLRKVVEQLSDDDLNWLAGQLSGSDLVEFARASKFKLLASLLIKRPRLALLARKLI